MYSSLLAALLLGMAPVTQATLMASSQWMALSNLTIAPPAAPLTLATRLSASGALVMDLSTGQTIFSRDGDAPRPMASLTKLMTALVIAENHDLGEWVEISPSAIAVEGNRAYLKPGEHFTVGNLLSAVLIASANDAALALAEFDSGSVEAFVEKMNARAAVLGLRHTSFANPVGLDAPDQYASPQDLAWLTAAALRHPAISDRMSRTGMQIHSREGSAVSLVHTHALLHSISPVIAGKTGTTVSAGECLVSVVRENGREFVVVLLHSLQRYGDMKSILHALSAPLA